MEKIPGRIFLSTKWLLTSLLLATPLSAISEQIDVPWFDILHDDISRSVNDSAKWLDDFFGRDGFLPEEEAKGGARILFGIEPRSGNLLEFETRVRIRVKLPKLSDRVDLIFSDFDEELERAPVKAAQNDVTPNQNRLNLALSWGQKKGEDAYWSNRVGIGRKAQLFARSQYTFRGDFDDSFHYRVQGSVFFYQRDGLGTHLDVQLEQDLTDKSVLRLDTNFFFRDESNDWLWQHNLYNMHQLTDSSALISGLYVEGLSQPNYRIEEYLVSVRWRKNAIREWLFFELEPFVLWRRDESFNASYGLAMRVEGYFGHY